MLFIYLFIYLQLMQQTLFQSYLIFLGIHRKSDPPTHPT